MVCVGSLQYAFCSLRSAVCSLQSAVCSLQSAACKCRTPGLLYLGGINVPSFHNSEINEQLQSAQENKGRVKMRNAHLKCV